MEYRVLTIEHRDLILDHERKALGHLDEIEQKMMEWKAPWREESLEHYLNLRWCMGIFSDDLSSLKSYFLAQPILYFEGQTQNLWIEHMYYKDADVGRALVDLAVKYGKDKYLQRVIFAENPILSEIDLPYKFIKKDNRYEVYTTKQES